MLQVKITFHHRSSGVAGVIGAWISCQLEISILSVILLYVGLWELDVGVGPIVSVGVLPYSRRKLRFFSAQDFGHIS